MIRWFARNDIASNLLMVAIVLAGAYVAFQKIPLEVRPTRDYGEDIATVKDGQEEAYYQNDASDFIAPNGLRL